MRQRLRKVLVGTATGLLVAGLAGLFLATQVLIQNPAIQDLRDRMISLIFFPAFYGAIGGLMGFAIAMFLALLPGPAQRMRESATVALTFAVVAGVFLLADSLARCYECHQWHRANWPSMTITPARSFLNMLGVIAFSALVATAIGWVVLRVGRFVDGCRRPLRTALLLLAAGLVAVTVAVGVAINRKGPTVHPPRYQPDMVRETGLGVRLIVMDGADWDLMKPFVDSGRMPNLARLMERGTWGDLGIYLPCISPYLWTSMSTGFSDAVHGLCDFYSYRLPYSNALVTRFPGGKDTYKRLLFRRLAITLGQRGIGVTVTANSRQKRVPELWDYLGDAGKRVCVVGWRYSYPATPVNGVMVSNRFGRGHRHPVVYPEALESRLQTDFSAEAEQCVAKIVGTQLASRSPEDLGHLNPRLEKIRNEMRFDVRFATVGRALIDSLAPDFAVVGLTSMDALCHQFMLEHVLGSRPNRKPLSRYFQRFSSDEEVELFAPTISRVHAVFDSLLGTILEDTEGKMVVLVSDHGHDQDGSGHRFGPPGIIVMAGGPVRVGGHLEDATVYDITPTILHAMGLPLSPEMHGRVLAEVLDEEWMRQHPVRVITTLGAESSVIEADSGLTRLSKEDLERLKSLGYIE